MLPYQDQRKIIPPIRFAATEKKMPLANSAGVPSILDKRHAPLVAPVPLGSVGNGEFVRQHRVVSSWKQGWPDFTVGESFHFHLGTACRERRPAGPYAYYKKGHLVVISQPETHVK